MSMALGEMGVEECVRAVKARRLSAVDLAEAALDRIAEQNERLNAATHILRDRALAEAAAVDEKIAAGEDPGPLAGVPYGVKDLCDVKGLPTTAGAGRLRAAPPAAADAAAVTRLRRAGAVLVATLNMDEFAYGFVTDNAHWGITRNPHDPDRFAGGSSGGSAVAVAAGMLPFSIGSDTNGSIRVPASLCGIFGIKPTHGSMPMEGIYPLAHSLDDIGIFARSAGDLALVDVVLREAGGRFAEPLSRPALLGGWFADNLAPEMQQALDCFDAVLGPLPRFVPNGVGQARSAAFLITAYEGGRLHHDALRADPMSYDPSTRDRLLAGAALPDQVYELALAFRDIFRAEIEKAFARYDVLIAPSAYGPAPLISHPYIRIDGAEQPARANLGLYTQPISYLGLPVVAAPLRSAGLPLGIQLIARPGCDAHLIRFAEELEGMGLIRAVPPSGLSFD
ncbi:MAG: AtzE family amidohydrolase [Sphingobium sp.]